MAHVQEAVVAAGLGASGQQGQAQEERQQGSSTTGAMMTGLGSEGAAKIEKLNHDNYVTWSANMEQVLKLKNCWEAVRPPPEEVDRALKSNSAPRSRSELTAVLQVPGETEDNKKLKAAARTELAVLDWGRKDEVALATLHLNVAAIHHATFRVSKTARVAWTALEELFRSRNMARSMDMRRRLATIQERNDEGMIEYVNRGTMLRYELGQLGQEQTEADLVAALLSGLPATYAITVELLESAGIPSPPHGHGAPHGRRGEAPGDGRQGERQPTGGLRGGRGRTPI